MKYKDILSEMIRKRVNEWVVLDSTGKKYWVLIQASRKLILNLEQLKQIKTNKI